MDWQRFLGKLFKGLYAAAVSVLGTLTTLLVGSTTFDDLTDGQVVALVLFGLVAFGGVFGLAGWAGPSIASTGSTSAPPSAPPSPPAVGG